MKWITLISPKFVIAVIFVCAIFIGPVCLNLSYDLKKLLWQDELNPRVRCAFGNVSSQVPRPTCCVRRGPCLVFFSIFQLRQADVSQSGTKMRGKRGDR